MTVKQRFSRTTEMYELSKHHNTVATVSCFELIGSDTRCSLLLF